MSGFDPTTQEENEKLGALCAAAIKEHGPMARVAVPATGFMIESIAGRILAECWERRTVLRRAAPAVAEQDLFPSCPTCGGAICPEDAPLDPKGPGESQEGGNHG